MMKKKTEIVSLRKGTSEIELNYADLRKAVLVLRAVNHKLRQRVIDLLEEHATMTVTDIYIKLRPGTVSSIPASGHSPQSRRCPYRTSGKIYLLLP
jgi:hypothetical protein